MELGINRRSVALLVILLGAGGSLAYLELENHREMLREAAAIEATRLKDGIPRPDVTAVPAELAANPPASPWFEKRTKRYAGLFEGAHCDVLVVPMQVENSGFDRPNRDIMTGDLALALGASGQCVADPFVVDPALGDGFRRRDPAQVAALAKTIHAREIVTVYAGHYRDGSMRVTLQRSQPDGATIAAHSFKFTGFDNEHPPFTLFHAHLPEMLTAVGIKTAALPANQPAGALPATLPQNFDTYLHPAQGAAATPLSQAAALMFLAIQTPATEWRSTDRLFSKAWLALQGADDSDPQVRLMRARILFHIYERPYALAVLGNDSGPAADGLRAMLNGNLPQARQGLAQVKGDWDRFFLGIEVADLELLYERPNRAAKEKALVAGVVGDSQFAAFVGRRLLDNDYWSLGSTEELQAVLDSAFPQNEGGILGPVKAVTSAVTETFGPGRELASIRHVHALVHDQPRLWCCSSFSTAPAASDLLDLFDSRIEHTLGRQAYYYYSPQANYERALEVSDAYADELAGNPCFEQTRADSYSALMRRGDRAHYDEWNAKMHQAARLVVWWDQVQSGDTEESLILMAKPPEDPVMHDLFGLNDDFPMRPYWFDNLHGSTAATRLPFSTFEQDALTKLLDASTGEEHKQYAALLDSRFIGGNLTTARRVDAWPAEQQTPEHLQAEIRNDPDSWELYRALAAIQSDHFEYDQAGKTILSYPEFNESDPADPVRLSNYAAAWGRDLLAAGAYGTARSLLEKSAQYQTGSSASNWAAIRLALLDHDTYRAAERQAQNAEHYNDIPTYRALASLLFAAGLDDQGWTLTNKVIQQYGTDNLWSAAMVGQRRANADTSHVIDWYANHLKGMSQGDEREGLIHWAFLTLTADREVPDDLAAAIGRLGFAADVGVQPDGKVYYFKYKYEDRSPLGPWDFGADRRPKLVMLTQVPDRYALEAEAMRDLRDGHYDQAVKGFDGIANYYDLGRSLTLPYFAYAAAKTGDTLGLKAYLDGLPVKRQGFSVFLSQAIFAALGHQPAEARALLEKTFRAWDRVYSYYYPEGAYEYIDVCALLYEATGETYYRDQALKLARLLRQVEPAYAFGHAAVAYLGTDPKERTEALVDALYLDPQSRWAAKAPRDIQAAARARLKSGTSPFKAGHDDADWEKLVEAATS